MPTLYFNWNAVCAMKVVLTLAEKKVDWTPKHIVLGNFEQLQPDYLAINPAGVVPALVTDDGRVILESSVIIEYLDDAYPDVALRPGDPADRARMRWWMRQVDDVVHPSVRPVSFTRFVAPRARALSEEQLAAMDAKTPKAEIAELWRRAARAPYTAEELAGFLANIRKVLIQMDAALLDGPWLAGDAYSLADIAMTPYFRRFEQLDKSSLWADLPATNDWWQRVQRRPSFTGMDALRLRYGSPDHPAAAVPRARTS